MCVSFKSISRQLVTPTLKRGGGFFIFLLRHLHATLFQEFLRVPASLGHSAQYADLRHHDLAEAWCARFIFNLPQIRVKICFRNEKFYCAPVPCIPFGYVRFEYL